jgi:anhydro-N-acetylmuramic acid kinase
MKTTEYFIGLMSGTSIDAIDAALVEISDQHTRLATFVSYPVPKDISTQLHRFIQSGTEARLDEYSRLDVIMGHLFAEAVSELLKTAGLKAEQIMAIGSHGQTLYHQPDGDTPTSLQIGDPNIIAEQSTITTVADFRRRDIAAGGQGAPLVPAYHQAMFHSSMENRCVVNIGGIANITILPADANAPVLGFDTGPGNTLLDQWIMRHLDRNMDTDAAFAQQGIANNDLLHHLLSDPYFSRPIPKSTGREYFNLKWLDKSIKNFNLRAEDIQATLCELTACSILNAMQTHAADTKKLLVCGGGARNPELMRLLGNNAEQISVDSCSAYGIDPDHVEAMAFAWLAYQTIRGHTSNITSVTGATFNTILGGIYPGKAHTAII